MPEEVWNLCEEYFANKEGSKTGIYASYARNATKNPSSSEVVLGKYNQDGISYVKVAEQRGATYFQLDNWDDVVNAVGETNIWNINEQFLIQQLEQGKTFIFSHNPYNATGYFAQEVQFFLEKGYKFIKSGDVWKAVLK